MMKDIYLVLGILMMAFMLISCQSGEQGNSMEEDLSPVPLSSSEMKASCVYLTTDENEIPIVSWVEIGESGEKRMFLAFWEAESEKFGSPRRIDLPDNTAVHEEGMPKVAVKGDGSVMMIYEVSNKSPHSKWGTSDILYRLSYDRGVSWTEAKSATGNSPDKGSHSFSGMTRLGDGEIGLAWLGESPGEDIPGRPVLFARSGSGEGFGVPVWIDSSACECCRVAVTGDKEGQVLVAYRDLLPGSIRDISMSISTDGGQGFQSFPGITDDQWLVEGCPHNGPSVARKNNENFLTWFSDGENPGVYFAKVGMDGSVSDKLKLNAGGRFSQLTPIPGESMAVAYNEQYEAEDRFYSRIILARINGQEYVEKEITLPRVHAGYPVLQPLDTDRILVAWSEDQRVYYKNVRMTSSE